MLTQLRWAALSLVVVGAAVWFLRPQWTGCACAVPVPTATPIICNYAGSPYLDPGIPDECEVGQSPQP